MKEEVPERLKAFTLQDIMELSRDLELLQKDLDMMHRFFSTDELSTITKKK